MIPDHDTILALWNTYTLPEYKQNHSRLVAKLAVWFATELAKRDPSFAVDIPLLESAALLHDIDKMAPKLEGEHHPDAGVRILREGGYTELADLVRTHPLHAILDQTISPKTWEQKLLYLADKMVKHSIITVDERFALWRAEQLPKEAVEILDRSYPLVKALEADVCTRLGIRPEEAALLANAV